ncbi:MAG: VCBS repeat-containing protein [Candidatus Absconditabacteria bacterium]|nr:VCBS repeat-containing protein [Candidatus Absconditabacteria bacterium]
MNRTNLIAVFVDKDVYQNSKNSIERYATDYIQQRVSNSKALILPINTQNFKAIDLVRMLENMYFDGIKGETSTLLGTVLIGDIPLPVVQNNGFVYPTIFPYVDFEEQQFIYDNNQKFFVYNNNPRGQAEIWHGIINFGSDSKKYGDYFQKLKTYVSSPKDFVAPLMWYDDFVGMKTTFDDDTLPFYVNNFLFTEDVGYHRFTNLMLDYFKQVQNDGVGDLVSSLSAASQNNPQLAQIASQSQSSLDALGSPKVPTTMLLSVIKELLKGYENLYPGVFLSAMKDNAQAAARWYKKTGSGVWLDGMDSHLHKIVLKDTLTLGDPGKGLSPLIVSFNDAMEKALDERIEEDRLYMTLPVIVQYNHQDFKTEKKRILGIPKRWCEKITDDIYNNYYFGTYAADITSAEQFSAYKGTFRNLNTFSGVVVLDTGYNSSNAKSLGSSNNLFSTQVDANRGYNLMSAAGDYDTYSENKIKEKKEISCSKWFLPWFHIFCMTKKSKEIGDTYESIEDFAIRGWGGASSLNLNSGLLSSDIPEYVLNQYNYKSALFPVYDIGGSLSVKTGNLSAYSSSGSKDYASLVKVNDRYGKVDYPKYIKGSVDNYPDGVYVSSGGYKMLSGTSRIWEDYNNFDFFDIWNKTSDKGSKMWKIIDMNSLKKEWKSSDSMGGKCDGKREIYSYTYKTIDSRIKNTSPTPDQINGTYQNEFSEEGLFWKHYDYLKENIELLKDQSKLSFDDAFSGLQFLLSGHKEINSGINSFVELNSTDPVALLSGVQDIFSQTGKQQYIEIFSGVFNSMEASSDTLPALNFGLVLAYFDVIRETETLYNQKTKFLSGWSNELLSGISVIQMQYNSLPSTFAQITGLYSQIENQKFATGSLITKKSEINKLQNCGTALLPDYCGCTNNYKQVCDKIDELVLSLDDLSQTLPILKYTTVEEEIDGEVVTIEIKIIESIQLSLQEASAEGGFLQDIPFVVFGINSIEKVDEVPPLTYVKGLNQTTQDRPIDGPRNITFQGLGGDVVTFVYPNLYDVSVYKQEGSNLVLKTIAEIQQGITAYLISKAKEYNQLLTKQEQKRQQYYNSDFAAFDFLAETDSLATPKNRTTELLSEDFFVNLIGNQRIFELAELMYYQTLPVYSKKNESYVDKDLDAIRTAFDVNKKISYILSGYLTHHENQGELITPTYNASGYEVAYINSDRADYISAAEMPPFIKQIQEQQKPISNVIIEDPVLSQNELYTATKAQCGIDSSYSELLFDLKEEQGKGKMPWVTAFECWLTTIPSSIKFDISMEVGPSFGDFLSGLQASLDDWKTSMKQVFDPEEEEPGAEFSGNIDEYWTNVIMITGDSVVGPKIKTISLETPTTKLLAGSQFPIQITAEDFSGKVVKRTMDTYFVYVSTGNGEFIGGGSSGPKSMEFSDFDRTLVYQAPNVQRPTNITVFLAGADVGTQKNILVTPGNFKVSYENRALYENNTLKNGLSFTLTGIDSTFSSVPRIVISLRAQDGSLLQTPFSVVSKNGLVSPGIISSGVFVGLHTYFLKNTEQVVFLMPNYRAGNDELYIQIPGLDRIVIPITVNPGKAYNVSINMESNIYNIGDSFSGSFFVSDNWGNPISGTAALKIGSLGALDFSTKTISVKNEPYSFSSSTKDPGGISYIYAFIDGIPLSDQSPAYKKIIVQETFLPQKNLNVMYLNLFGSDWGDIWTFDAINPNYIPNLINSSQKLLSITTQITDTSSIKKFASVVSDNGQIYNFSNRETILKIDSGFLIGEIKDVANISLFKTKDISLFSSDKPIDSIKSFSSKNSAALFFEKNEDTKDIEITDKTISLDGQLLFDIKNNLWNTGLKIVLSDSMKQGYNVWNILYEEEQIGNLYFVKNNSTLLSDIVLYNVVTYDKTITFAEGSTNGQKGIGIVDVLGVFEKEGYASIEDSNDYELGIGFRSDFKNITLFGDGKSVGESTIPFGSQFLINFGDPLLTRISNNNEIKSVSMDLGIGEQIYTNPSKSIFKVIDTDFNNDGLKDILVVFTDGTIKFLKNYGGTHPYTNMQDLIRLADSIKDVFVGDVDGNNYPDILVWTNSDQLRVYKNDKGIVDVDGNMICLNINVDNTKVQENPESVVGLQQLFFEDMDKDGSIDIVTNDLVGDIKVFYGGSKNSKANYVSTLPYACDDDWYDRQKDNVKLVKSFGVVVDPDFYIQDDSMIHVEGWLIENQSDSINDSDSQGGDLPDELDIPMGEDFDIGTFVSSMSNYSQQLAYDSLSDVFSVAPVSYMPSYESGISLEKIGYRTLIQLSGNDSISVYKKYKDLNGGALLSGDIVKINTTIVGLQNNTKATYFDRILGPWEVETDDENKIISFAKESGEFDMEDISWFDSDDSFFVLDNIILDNRQSMSFSYQVVYRGEPTVAISVEDVDFLEKDNEKDEYLDIVVTPLDSCQKYRWLFFNTSSQSHRSYQEEFDDIQAKIDSFSEDGLKEGQELFDKSVPEMSKDDADDECDEGCAKEIQDNTQSLIDDAMNSVPAIADVFESWTVSDLFSSSTETNFEINMDAINSMLAPVSEGLDKLLDDLCAGFKLGSDGCQPPFPFNKIPFNQAFLAPGKYHIFGCTPTIPHPLAPIFTIINDRFGAGFPLLFFPGTLQTPVGPVPMIGSSFVPIVQQMPGSDGFGLSPGFPPTGGTYPSQIRLYLVPTLTLQLGVAICFGPYKLGTALPPLVRDLGGQCVVVAFPLYTCNKTPKPGSEDEPSTEKLDSWMVDSAKNGSCDEPMQYGSAKVISNTTIIQQQTQKSPFRLSSVGAQNSSWTSAVPNANIGYVSFSSKPTKKSSLNTNPAFVRGFNLDPFSFLQGPTVDLKIKDSNAKGIIKALVKDWFGRQVKYMINNLTTLTINVTLPDISQLADGFGGLFSATAWNSASEESDNGQFDYIKDAEGFGSKLKAITSRQTYAAASSATNNPFESLITIFQSIPLVDLYTKDVVIKIPLPTSDDIVKYENYGRTWLDNQKKILKKWLEAVHELAYVCGKVTKEDAETGIKYLEGELSRIEEIKSDANYPKLKESLNKEKDFLEDVLEDPSLTDSDMINIEDVKAVLNDIGRQFEFFGKRVVALPRLNFVKTCLESSDSTGNCKPWATLNDKEKINQLSIVNKKVDELSSCASFAGDLDSFVNFYNDALGLVRNVQQNIQVLEQYKQFPLQLYDWMHFVDKYMSDIIGFVSTLSSTLMGWMNVNARIYAKWIDSLILILTTIKTYQVLIDLTVNWTKNCGKCSRDGYGAHGCSLSFLFPQIPIIPIPPFKIPNINIDFSHVDLGISIALPRFVFVPVDFPLPQLPSLPSPPDFNLALGLDFKIDLKYDLPQIPLLPSPPNLPELPSFIPKIDFSLPTILPPAPKIPSIIPEVSTIIEIAELVSKIFCILKKGIGLVGEKGIKAKVEQLTQRTWDVPIFDFFNQTFSWNADPKPQGFDYQIDGFLQFKMDFSGFYGFLNQISEYANSLTYSVTSAYSKGLDFVNSGSNSITNFLDESIQDVDLDFTIPPLDISVDALSSVPTMDYEVAYKELNDQLFTFKNSVEEQKIINDVESMISVLNTKAVVNPATENIQKIHDEIQTILDEKQKEVRQLATSISSYDNFIAKVKRNDIALVNDDNIEISFSSPLFTTTKETYEIIENQESPLKAYMDTNSSLVGGYLQSLEDSSYDELKISKDDYENTKTYLESMKLTIDNVYDKLGFDKVAYSYCGVPSIVEDTTKFDSSTSSIPLLAQSCPTCGDGDSGGSPSGFGGDISSYVRGVFVEDSQSGNMVNVVRSDSFISNIRDRYFVSDINNNNLQDLVMRDNNSIYVKYAKQETQHKNTKNNSSLFAYSPGIFSSYYINSYDDLLEKTAKDDGYVDFGNISVKLTSSVQEVKNFRVAGQSFDAIQMSWINHDSFGETVDGYLIKLNHRIDTYNDKDTNFRFLDDKFLNKRYILMLPNDSNYSGSTIDFKEKYYYKGKDADRARSVVDFLSGGMYSELILAVKFYQPAQKTISLGLNEIPRNWQYAEIIPLKNTNNEENPYYIPSGPWSNQIVAGRQILSDSIGPEALIHFNRPSISETVSVGSRHNGFVGTNYDIVIDWKDNVAVSDMWIEKDGKIISSSKANSPEATIQLTGLYFTGETKLEYIAGAQDFNGNKQLEKITIEIKTPTIEIKDFIPISEFSGQLVAELSNDIDQGMVVFQRQRNDVWQEMSGTLANTYGGFFVGPNQTTVTGSVFSMGNTLGLYDNNGNEIGQITIDGQVTILPIYQDQYQIMLDLVTGYPLVRVLDKKSGTTVFWIQMPSTSLSDVTLYQQEPFYTKVDLTESSFGAFFGGTCIQSLDKDCVLYISSIGQIYIPNSSSTSLVGEYRYDTTTRSVIYVIKDFLEKDIVRITTKTRLMK